jgi:hypothetical protein
MNYGYNQTIHGNKERINGLRQGQFLANSKTLGAQQYLLHHQARNQEDSSRQNHNPLLTPDSIPL